LKGTKDKKKKKKLKRTKGSIKKSPIALGWACQKQLGASIFCFF
jgi:hypothetical protein